MVSTAMALLVLGCSEKTGSESAVVDSSAFVSETSEPVETGVDTTDSDTQPADETGDSDTEPVETGDTGLPWSLAIPTGGCGAPAYDWVPLDDMGRIVDKEQDLIYSLGAAEIDALMQAFGLGDFTPVANGVEIWRVRYITQDRGEAIEASGIISFPDVPEPKDVPLLLYAHPTMGFTDECAPSAGSIEGLAGAVVFGAQGMAVATPDYLGMNGFGDPAGFLHPYIAPEPTAVASLDSVRATLRLADDLGVNARPDPNMALFWGASEGGFAALWAARYAEAGYAPELTIAGVVAAVPPLDVMGLAQHGATTLGDTTWGTAAALVTQNPWYGEPAPITDAITDDKPHFLASTLPEEMASSCSGYGDPGTIHSTTEVFSKTVHSAFSSGDFDAAGPFGCYTRLATLTDPTVGSWSTAPTLVVLAEDDELVVTPPQRDDITTLCDLGMTIEYHECAGTDHVSGAVDSTLMQWDWLQDRVAGLPLKVETCVVHEPEQCEGLPGF